MLTIEAGPQPPLSAASTEIDLGVFFCLSGKASSRTVNEVIEVANGRNVLLAGLAGMALGIYVGNTMNKGYVTRQLRSTGRSLIRRARGTVEHQLNNWMD